MTKAKRKWIHERDIKVMHRFRRKLRAEILAAYGNECACCGETRKEFLTIDHIEGGGNKHRDTIKRYGTAFYQWLRKFGYPPGYRILCYNCNCARGRVGYCPHELET